MIKINKSMFDKVIKLERKIVKILIGLPKSTNNKIIELFMAQYSFNNTYNYANKITEELMPLWEQRERDEKKIITKFFRKRESRG